MTIIVKSKNTKESLAKLRTIRKLVTSKTGIKNNSKIKNRINDISKKGYNVIQFKLTL